MQCLDGAAVHYLNAIHLNNSTVHIPQTCIKQYCRENIAAFQKNQNVEFLVFHHQHFFNLEKSKEEQLKHGKT